MSSTQRERLLCCRITAALLEGQGSLASHLATARATEAELNHALLQEYCYGLCRWYPRLDAWSRDLLDKPLRSRDRDLHCLILLGLYQLFHMQTAAHAAVNETVEACVALGKPWAKNLVNAALRKAQREAEALAAADLRDYARLYAHPQWLLDRLKKDWPRHYRELLDANNARAPMTLRTNRKRTTREACLGTLAAAGISAAAGLLTETAIVLAQPLDVNLVPGFAEGLLSVQDEASQLLPTLLPLRAGLRVLDACAAPGGKTCALLEACEGLKLLAIDNEPRRLPRISENLERLGLEAEVACADITAPDFTRGPFDLILLDAPCSATGVIRRHPDIKLLRTPAEVAGLAAKQAALLDTAWPLLVPGGLLLYSTCSVLQEENSAQIARFLAAHRDASELPLDISGSEPCAHGRQLLPRQGGNDGFYYALLQKC